MTPYLILGDEPHWSAPVEEFDAVLERTAAQLASGEPLHERLERARRRGSADLRGFDRVGLARLLEAVHTAYVRMVRVWRAGFPDARHDDVLPYLGGLAQRLEAAVSEPVERWSLRRLQAFGGAIDACFPGELSRALLPLVRDDAAAAEHVLRVLRDRDVDEDASAIAGAAFLPAGRKEGFFLECARHRREAVRFTLFKLLTGARALPDPGSLTSSLSEDATTQLLRLGIADPSPRVRERAIAYAYGAGRVASVRAELVAALSAATRDPDETCRAYELLALGVLDGADTLALLTRSLEEGTPAESTAAVWALARRPDGIARVVAAVEDPRPEVRPEAIGAIMHVGGPLTAEHAAWLESPERASDVREAVGHNRRRAGIPATGLQSSITRGSPSSVIRYRLLSPATAGQTQRDEAVVWLDARYLDQWAQLHIDGEPVLVAAIRDALDQAKGRWGHEIGGRTMPIDVAVAMGGEIMKPFDPVLIEGADVLAHRQPPAKSPDELADNLARILAEELIVLPVTPIDSRSYEGEGTVRSFAERQFEWSYWRPTQPSVEAAALALAPRLRAAAAAAIDDLTDSLASADEDRRRAGRPAVGERLLRWPVDPAQWLPIAREIVAAFDAASDTDPVALTHDFQRRMAGLTIGR